MGWDGISRFLVVFDRMFWDIKGKEKGKGDGSNMREIWCWVGKEEREHNHT